LCEVYSFIHFAQKNIMHWKHVWHIDKCVKDKIWSYEWPNFVWFYIFVCQICFECMKFVCEMYLSMNEQTLYNFHYQIVEC
jgi:hypothetical protein